MPSEPATEDPHGHEAGSKEEERAGLRDQSRAQSIILYGTGRVGLVWAEETDLEANSIRIYHPGASRNRGIAQLKVERNCLRVRGACQQDTIGLVVGGPTQSHRRGVEARKPIRLKGRILRDATAGPNLISSSAVDNGPISGIDVRSS